MEGGDTQAIYERARAQLAAGEAAAAEAEFGLLLQLDPRHVAALRGLAEAYAAQGREEEARGQRALADAMEADAFAAGGVDLLRVGREATAEGAFRRALEVDPHCQKALKGLGDLARRRGDLAEAVAHYEALLALSPDFVAAKAGVAALTGKPLHGPLPRLTLPVPFLQKREFLAPARRDQAFDYGMSRLTEMQEATVVEEGGSEVQLKSRKARLLYEPPEISAWFLPEIETALPAVCAALGIAPFEPSKIELQMTLHTGGDFYRAHRDVSGPDEAKSEIDRRCISFVYYMSRQPRPFSGGELRLYDCDADTERARPDWADGRHWDEHLFSLVEPEDNSIVFFPSPVMHEVCPVDLDSDDPADGRLTLNGWVHGAG
jgi:Rps23 Pro-64 3,4-dihydroxylase Tpa1-like proline 4-hydroxylase